MQRKKSARSAGASPDIDRAAGAEHGDAYLAAVEHAHRLGSSRPSIVNASIASAIEGHYGDYHRTDRTQGSELWISPLMAQYFAFELTPVAQRVMYLDQLAHTRTMFEIVAIIEAFRKGCPARSRRLIPV